MKKSYLEETSTFDFAKPEVKKWMDEHKMWQRKNEPRIDFVLRVRKELRDKLPYDTKDGGPWVCSQILKVGYGECCRHAIVGTSILRANKIPARTVCSVWAIDDKSQGGHCWTEFFEDGVGWITCDTTGGSFGDKAAEHLAGMIDFEWKFEAGPFGKQTVQGIDAWPAWWGEGKGNTGNGKDAEKEKVRVLQRFR